MKRSAIAIALALGSSVVSAHPKNESHTPEKVASEVRELTAEKIEVMTTGRYTAVKNIAPMDQLNPLKVVIKTRIPQSVQTVRQAVDFLLVRSGYQIADDVVLSTEAKTLLGHQLPQVHRKIGPMTLDRALRTLAGDAFSLIVDPVNRRVGYELSALILRAG